MSEQDAVAVEREAELVYGIAKAIASSWGQEYAFDETCPTFDMNIPIGIRKRAFKAADTAITAHTAWLRERSRDADVVEAILAVWPDQLRDFLNLDDFYIAELTTTAALDAMIGKEQPHDDR